LLMQLKMVAEFCENDADILDFLFLKLSRLDPNIGSTYNFQISYKDNEYFVFEDFIMRCLTSVDPSFFNSKFLYDANQQIEVHTHKFLQIWAHITEYYEDILKRDLTKMTDCCVNVSKLFDNKDHNEMVKVLFIILNLAVQSSSNFSFLTKDIPPSHEDIFQKWLQFLFAMPKYENIPEEGVQINGGINETKPIDLEYDSQRIRKHYNYIEKQCYSLSRCNMELENKFKEMYAIKDENRKLNEMNTDLARQCDWEKKKRLEAEKNYKAIIDESEDDSQRIRKLEDEVKLLKEKLMEKDLEIDNYRNTISDLRLEICHYKKICDESITDGAVNSSNLNDSKTQLSVGERLSDSVLKGVSSLLANKENEQPHSSMVNSFQSPSTVRQKDAINFIANVTEEQSKLEDDLQKANIKINDLEIRIGNLKRDLALRDIEMAQSQDLTVNLEKKIEELTLEKDKLCDKRSQLEEEHKLCEDIKNKLEQENNKLCKKLEKALHEKEQIPTKLNELNETLHDLVTKVTTESMIHEEPDDSTGRLVTQNNFILKTLIIILSILIFFPIALVYTCRLYNLPLFEVFTPGTYFSSSRFM
uniref:HOOK N-terminal domain-containing protein n=2 Tax=Strongyloides stercoralis TaxID=6248 RepID=A0AAF5DH22_STRER